MFYLKNILVCFNKCNFLEEQAISVDISINLSFYFTSELFKLMIKLISASRIVSYLIQIESGNKIKNQIKMILQLILLVLQES